MIVRSGLACSIPILFEQGLPNGSVHWSLLDGNGVQLSSGSATAPANAMSIHIAIDGSLNNLPPLSFSASRDFDWNYTAESGALVANSFRYSIEARAPWGASPDGVRRKLGVSVEDVSDDDISLMTAYRYLRTTAGANNIEAVVGGDNDAVLRDAIEAFAALSLLPTMQVRVAASESSGTNQFKRQAIDWSAVEIQLSDMVDAGILLALPTYDPLSESAALFVLATPATDPYTGSAYV